jgi:hypothetical protein
MHDTEPLKLWIHSQYIGIDPLRTGTLGSLLISSVEHERDIHAGSRSEEWSNELLLHTKRA